MTKLNQSVEPDILVIGEVLFDIFPDYRRLGGAPFNFAVHMHKIGFNTTFVSRIGNDRNGQKIIEFMEQTKMSRDLLQQDPQRSTGYVTVNLDNHGGHQFDIHQNVAYDNLNYNIDIEHFLTQPLKLIYFGTLIQRTRKGFDVVQQILKNRHPTTRTFCDLNFRPGCYNRDVVLASLKQADVLKLNHEELQEIGHLIDFQKTNRELVTHLMNTYQIKVITVTHGAAGSEWFSASDLHNRADSPKINALVDTVGAGDGFAAAIASGYLKNWPVQHTLTTASQFAARICQIKGALPVDDRPYDELKKKRPFL